MCRESVISRRQESRRPVRGGRTPLIFVAALACVTAACTGHSPHPSGQAQGSVATPPALTASVAPVSSSPPPLTAVLRVQPQPVSVIGGTTPEQLSVNVSKALFTSAPAAVVSSSDRASMADGSATARRIGVPLLISDRPPGSAAGSGVEEEVHRLGCDAVLMVGDPPALAGVHAVHDVAELPAISLPAARRDMTVLVHASDDAGTVAAAATARAAGTQVVPVRGHDPRTDPAAIDALAQAPTQHVLAVGADFGPPDKLTSRLAVARTGTELPGGGQTVFPGRRFVALYGHPSTAALGVLGAQDLDASIVRARLLAASYDALSDVPVVPTFEIIATVAQASAGRDGNYSAESSAVSLRPWVEAAQAAGLYVVLDLQPGSADLLAQAKSYATLLQQPNVGLAVDPEWALAPGQRPLQQIGTIDAVRINAVAAWLDALTASKHLPQKLFVLHQFRLSMIGNESKLKTDYDNLAMLIHMDGQGTQSNKNATWRSVVTAAPHGVPFGWKNFYRQDHPVLTPEQTMARNPRPMMISYQ